MTLKLALPTKMTNPVLASENNRAETSAPAAPCTILTLRFGTSRNISVNAIQVSRNMPNGRHTMVSTSSTPTNSNTGWMLSAVAAPSAIGPSVRTAQYIAILLTRLRETGTRQMRLNAFSMRIISSSAVRIRKKVPGSVSRLTLPRKPAM